MATTAAIQAVQEAYIAYYGRPADPSGLTYWADRVDAEGGIDALIGQFGTSAEATSRFGALSINDAVDAIYQQIFNRAPDASGKAFYVDKLLRGEFTLVTIAQNIWDGSTGSDATITANKLTAAQAFTDALAADADSAALYSGDGAAANARNWLSNVDATEASVTAAADSQAATITGLQNAPSNPGSTFSLTTSTTDVLVGTSKDDTFNASLNTLQSGDTISDSSSSDSDVLNIAVTSAGIGPKVTNVETINVTAEYLTGGLDLTNVVGATTVSGNSNLLNGTMTFSGANTLAVQNIEIGDNIAVATITTAASGTRDTVGIDLGQGVSGVIIGGAGVDQVSITAGSGTNVVVDNGWATSTDKVTLTNDGVASNGYRGTSTLASTTLNASGDYTLNITNAAGSGFIVNNVAGTTTTLNFSGNATLLNRLTVSETGDGTTVVDIGRMTAGSTVNMGGAVVDRIDLSEGVTGGAGSGGYLLINEASQLQLNRDLQSAGITLGLGTGTAALATGAGTLRLALDAAQSASTTSITTSSSVGTLMIESVTGASTLNVEQIALDANTTVLSLVGSYGLTIKHLSASTSALVTAANLGTGMTFSGNGMLTAVNGSSYDDVISWNGSATSIYAGAGNDDLNLIGSVSSGAINTVYLQDGDDTIRVSGAATTTIYGGDGADTYEVNLDVAAANTIADFVVGTDKIVLFGSADLVNVAGQSASTTSVYAIAPLTTGGSATLTGNTATDFSESIQLGLDINNPLTHVAAQATAITGSASFHDYIQVNMSAGSTLTLGAGADHVELVLNNTALSSQDTTIADFVVGEDVLVLTGTAHIDMTRLDAYSASISAGGALSLGNSVSAEVVLKFGGTGITSSGLQSSLQLGHSAGSTAGDMFTIGSAQTIVLGTLNDNIVMPSVASTSTVTIKDGGGIDFIQATSALEVRYSLTGLSNDLVTGLAAGATKVSNALSGSTYIFADGESGAASSKIEYVGSASVTVGQADMTGVATFLNANLGGTTGEQYLAVINDLSGNAAYAYTVLDANADGSIEASELSLITVFDLEDGVSTSEAGINKADLT